MKLLILALFMSGLTQAQAAESTARNGIDQKIVSEVSSSKGFKVMTLEPGSVFEKLNIREGDVILSANGKNIENIKDAQSLYTEPKVQDLYVRRNGKIIRIDE